MTADSPGTCAVFLDPPYSTEANRSSVYSNEDFNVAHAVRKWCIDNGDNPNLKIALCGYDVEHSELEADYGWEAVTWSASGGYSTFSKAEQSKKNKHREVIWFSLGCAGDQAKLF